MVRNIPFQAKQNEIQEIFQLVSFSLYTIFIHFVLTLTFFYLRRAFGEVRTVRLPKKMAVGEESHRGFGFVDFFSESDAKVCWKLLLLRPLKN